MTSRAPAPPAPAPPPDATPAALVRWVFDVLNTHTTAPLRGVLADDVRDRLPTRTLRGPAAVTGWFDALFAAMPDAVWTIEAMAAQDATVFVRWRMTGTHTGGEFEGLAATGTRVDLDGVDQFVVRDGRVVTNFVVFDQMQFARQVGLLPAEGSRPEVALRRGFNLLARRRAARG